MWLIILSVVSVFAVLGIDCLIREIVRAKFRNPPSVVVCGYNNENEIEYVLLRAMFMHPDSEIYVLGGSGSDILKRMMRDYPNIHTE